MTDDERVIDAFAGYRVEPTEVCKRPDGTWGISYGDVFVILALGEEYVLGEEDWTATVGDTDGQLIAQGNLDFMGVAVADFVERGGVA